MGGKLTAYREEYTGKDENRIREISVEALTKVQERALDAKTETLGPREEGRDRRGCQEGKVKEVRVRMSLAGVSGLAIWMGGSATEMERMINAQINFGHVMFSISFGHPRGSG